MQNNSRVLVLDAGNTALKLAIFQDGALREVRRFSPEEKTALTFYILEEATPLVVSSVLSEADTRELIMGLPDVVRITAETPVAFPISYASADTLGIDRLCNAAYLHSHCDTLYGVSVDIGTCIKFDLFHRALGYTGGSISPGIHLRYHALHDYTGKLPLLSNKSHTELVGSNTQLSMQSGVINGMEAEIQGMIDRYESEFADLTFFVTGGDAAYFEFHSKNNIFADENLTLKGLFEIYRHNA